MLDSIMQQLINSGPIGLLAGFTVLAVIYLSHQLLVCQSSRLKDREDELSRILDLEKRALEEIYANREALRDNTLALQAVQRQFERLVDRGHA